MNKYMTTDEASAMLDKLDEMFEVGQDGTPTLEGHYSQAESRQDAYFEFRDEVLALADDEPNLARLIREGENLPAPEQCPNGVDVRDFDDVIQCDFRLGHEGGCDTVRR